MKLTRPLHTVSRILHSLFLKIRAYLPRRRSYSFVPSADGQQSGITQIYVINLDRQPERWIDVLRELGCILGADGEPLTKWAVRYSANDARNAPHDLEDLVEIDPFYTLGDQLYVEPQPHALPDEFDLDRPIRMSPAEIAIARSHIEIWRTVAESDAPYALVVEDDVWFERCFANAIDQAWREMREIDKADPAFDILYLSYAEARHGAPKELISENVFRPERGLWYLSGYVLSKKGAQKLLRLLPCRGPIDLWINHLFHTINVRALRRPVIHQRLDLVSTNSYSILPALSKIGVLDYSNAALFQQQPTQFPVFAFGRPGSGLSSLAIALSMLGYRCCSDIERIPEAELKRILAGSAKTVFNAYVNVGSLEPHLRTLMSCYPQAKFIVTEDKESVGSRYDEMMDILDGADVVRLNRDEGSDWRVLCEHLRLPPPTASYPTIKDIGQRKHRDVVIDNARANRAKLLKSDRTPWSVGPYTGWNGINASPAERPRALALKVSFDEDLINIQPRRWLLRSDTFPGNLGLFRPANASIEPDIGLALKVGREALGVRDYSAAAISSSERFLYGRFEATLQVTNVSGLVTGFFLYRSSPRQEIDIEITGNCPTRLLVNVFYNPGSEGAKFDYGYRGTPVAIPLGFDSSKAPHRYAIEWDPCEIRWLVDGELVHRRVIWNPTPVPDLPMTLHLNTWPTRSRELAGRLAVSRLPASTIVRNVSVDAYKADRV
ncbi:family 16 glycosylhydrolase [Bradyrhizobium sp. G127]|uniref:family 16 glycosylhydrolase n=1 Tax=Bradyrhizobium sp. G127 TaxID=2904800 RepID=UPI001F3477EA|nr:family 16 glycosylhydrolase [Bradyrhizobium sp. G127]MCF2525424.1 family 16 glycosylhydrolase [Bradyrhizobium sp. G127]